MSEGKITATVDKMLVGLRADGWRFRRGTREIAIKSGVANAHRDSDSAVGEAIIGALYEGAVRGPRR